MQIVIDIPEDAYNYIKANGARIPYYKLSDAIKKGTPLKTGHWINDEGLYKCTVCNSICSIVGWANCIPKEQMYKAVKYCPNCGADMRKEQE